MQYPSRKSAYVPTVGYSLRQLVSCRTESFKQSIPEITHSKLTQLTQCSDQYAPAGWGEKFTLTLCNPSLATYNSQGASGAKDKPVRRQLGIKQFVFESRDSFMWLWCQWGNRGRVFTVIENRKTAWLHRLRWAEQASIEGCQPKTSKAWTLSANTLTVRADRDTHIRTHTYILCHHAIWTYLAPCSILLCNHQSAIKSEVTANKGRKLRAGITMFAW